MNKDQSKKLAEEHWKWLESVLAVQREMEKKLFIDGWVHGAKHQKESTDAKRPN